MNRSYHHDDIERAEVSRKDLEAARLPRTSSTTGSRHMASSLHELRSAQGSRLRARTWSFSPRPGLATA